jgi:hypothetical protein
MAILHYKQQGDNSFQVNKHRKTFSNKFSDLSNDYVHP